MNHWKIVNEIAGWLQVECPTYQANEGKKVPLSINRQIYREWKEIENLIVKNNIKGWIANTEIDNWPMIRIITRVGAKPYRIDIINKLIWFNKLLTEDK
jgi:hypothetical protein